MTTYHRNLQIGPSSFDRENNRVEVIFATSAPVPRRGDRGEVFIEVLSLDPAAVDRSRLDSGMPFLRDHDASGIEHVIGSTVPHSARMNGTQGSVQIQLSSRPDVAGIVQDIAAGVLRGISCGYSVQAWSKQPSRDGNPPTWTATRWTPHEISLVAVPADHNATIRGLDMIDDTTQTDETTDTTTRARPDNTTARKQERDLATKIDLAHSANLPLAFVRQHEALPLDQFRMRLIDEMIERERAVGPMPGPASRIDQGDGGESFVRSAGEALFMRSNPRHQPSPAARRYVGQSTIDLAREALEHVGERTRGMSPGDVFSRAMTTSDFPKILGDAVGRTLRKAYLDAPAGLRAVARETTARDFRLKHRLQLSSAPQLELVNEHGEFKHGGMSELDETYRVSSYGKILSISRQAIVNDDVGAFSDMAARMGRAAVGTENQLLADLVASNPVMSDGVAIFHASHGNLAAAPSAVDGMALSAARVALRSQRGLAGEFISVTPKYLVVGPTRETEAEKELAIINPTATDDVNVFGGKLKLVVDPRLGVEWYLIADPTEIDGLEFAYLEGAAGPRIETRTGFEIDAVEIKVSMDFGAGFVDWRSWYKHPAA